MLILNIIFYSISLFSLILESIGLCRLQQQKTPIPNKLTKSTINSDIKFENRVSFGGKNTIDISPRRLELELNGIVDNYNDSIKKLTNDLNTELVNSKKHFRLVFFGLILQLISIFGFMILSFFKC